MTKTYTDADVELLVNEVRRKAIEDTIMTVNDSNFDSGADFRNRMSALMSGGYDFADTLHNIFIDFGYPDKLSFSNFYNMYRRFGIAKSVVEIYPGMGWKESPQIEFTNTAATSEFDTIVKNLKVWERLRGLDIRQRIGQYAGMFMRVRDSKTPDTELVGTLSGPASLVDMIPLYESQLRVIEIDRDNMSDNFGQPLMYEYRGTAEGNKDPHNVSSFNIHPSRIIIAAEGSDNGSIYGISALESIYNSLMDMRKIIGAGGEGFYKNASQSVLFNLKDPASAKANVKILDKFNENYDDFSRNRMRRAIWTPGMEANTLDSMLVDPKEFFMNALYDVAAGSEIPATVLIGQQTGRLASDQDAQYLLSNVQARRLGFQNILLSDFLNWLMKYGVLTSSDFEIEWPDALAKSDVEKLDNAGKMALANKTQFESGQPNVFESREIRIAAGFAADPSPTLEDTDADMPKEALPAPAADPFAPVDTPNA
jgi:hypothetical protein